MSYEVKGKTITMIVAADTPRWSPVKMDANGKAVLATANTDLVIGFTQATAVANEAVAVMIDGITMAPVSAAIAVGAKVAPTTDGTMLTSAAGFVGIAMEAATAAKDVIAVLIRL